MKFIQIGIGIACLVAIGCSGGASDSAANTPNAAAADVKYASVQQIFDAKCVKCHGDQNPKDGISLTNYANVIKGSPRGPIVVAGDPTASLLARSLHGNGAKQMPFNEPPLPDADIATVESWIKAGAKE